MALAFPSHITMDQLRDVVIWDSGSGDHNFNDLKWFEDYEAFESPSTMLTAGGPGIRLGKGRVRLKTTDDRGKPTEMAFDDVYYAPNTPLNMISAGKLKRQVKFDAEREVLTYIASGRTIAMAKWTHDVPWVTIREVLAT